MPEKLSDHEIRDITKALEAGKPLDDKYRYLLFKEARQVELIWNGKNPHVQNTVLPFQIIEHIDEPRDDVKLELQPSLFDTSGKKLQGWSNKLIWGDNKYVLSSLKSGPIRDEIEANGGIKLIYIDPPFDVGADFSTTIEIGDTEFEKAPTV
jgi:adenine-specific DNA-methyltransferase